MSAPILNLMKMSISRLTIVVRPLLRMAGVAPRTAADMAASLGRPETFSWR